MVPLRTLTAILLATALTGCDTSETAECPIGSTCYVYLASAPDGVPAVSGTFEVRTASDGRLSGVWRTDRVGEGEVGPQVGGGELAGEASGETVTLTLLTVGAAVAVELDGVRSPTGVEGQWTWRPPSGGARTGTFELFADAE